MSFFLRLDVRLGIRFPVKRSQSWPIRGRLAFRGEVEWKRGTPARYDDQAGGRNGIHSKPGSKNCFPVWSFRGGGLTSAGFSAGGGGG